MKVIDKYDYDENLNERYCGSTFVEGTGEPKRTHTYSYLHCRKVYQELGDVMGLEKEVEK